VEIIGEFFNLSVEVIEFIGAPGGIRTPNPQIRSLMLCPVELQAPHGSCRLLKIDDLQTFFKKEPVKRRRDLPVGDEHRTLR
jgi:hypothetical protein